MSDLTVSTFLTLDGVTEAPEKWSFNFHDEQNMNDALRLLLDSDALLLGRVTYEAFADSWPGRTDPMGFADKMNTMPKYVVSRTLTDPTWANTTVLDGDPVDAVRQLKSDVSGHFLMYGSGTLMRSLVPSGLIDEYRFLLNPVVVGRGRRLFDDPDLRATFELATAVPYPGGMTSLRLRPAGPGE